MWSKEFGTARIDNVLPYLIQDFDDECNGTAGAPAFYDKLQPIAWTICVMTVLSNLVIVVCTFLLLKKGEEPRCTYMLLGNIAVSDFVTGVIQILEITPMHISYTPESQYRCIFIAGTMTAITLVSIYSVVLISIDRFLYIIHGIRYNQLMLPHKAGFMILGVWSLGIFLGIVPLFFWSNENSKDDLCWYPQIAKPELVIAMSIFGILPVLYVLLLYSVILYKALKNIILIRRAMPKIGKKEKVEIKFYKGKVKQKHETFDEGNKLSIISKKTYSLQIYTVNLNENEAANDINKTEKLEDNQNVKTARISGPSRCKAIKVVVLTTGCFAFTWVPYFLLAIIFVTTNKDDDINKWCSLLVSLRIASYVGVLNSFLNPFIYAWWHNRFRESVKKLYCGKDKTKRVPQVEKQ